MKKGFKKSIALLLSGMMVFTTSLSAFPAIAENNLILKESENSNSSDYEFYNSKSEITVTTCETQEIQTETTTTTISSVEDDSETTTTTAFETESEETETTTTITDSGDSGDVDNENVYQIGDAEQLYSFINEVNNGKRIDAVLTADIVVNENLLASLKFDTDGNVTNGESFRKWELGSDNKNNNKYYGTFDGQNHTISGLYLNNIGATGQGFLGYNYGTIKNVGIIDSYFNSADNAGGICGINEGTIENSYNASTVSSPYNCVGGICGINYGTIINSYNTGKLIGEEYVGGICGKNRKNENQAGTITNTYNTGKLNYDSSSYFVGGICGETTGGTITNSYYDDSVCGKAFGHINGGVVDKDSVIGKTSAQFSSGEVAYLLQDEIWGQEIKKDNLPILNGKKVYQNIICSGCCEEHQGDITYVYSNTQANPVYSEHQYENGICTIGGDYEPAQLKNNYYQISNAGNLLWFAQQVNSGKLYINAILTTDIVVNEKVLNADGTLVTDFEKLRIWTPIGNYSNRYRGTFDGNNHTISGLYYSGNIDNVGLFGYNFGTIKNVGIIDSYFKGKNNVGGVCGYSLGTITNSYNTSTVSGTNNSVGGVCGYNEYTIENSYNTGSVSGSAWNVGGVCGYNNSIGNSFGKIENSHNTGSVSGTNNNVGGVCGYNGNNSTITNSYNTGTVSGTNNIVGGVCGYNGNNSTITNSHNTGSVSGPSWVGGVCGENSSNSIIKISYNTGTVSGSKKVGGVCGENSSNSTIKISYNIGSVSGSENVGGVCGGNNSGTIENSYNIGTVSGSKKVGGVCGENSSNSTIKISYNIGSVSGGLSNVGGVCGFNIGTIKNSYYLKNCNADRTTFTNDDGIAQTSEQFASGEVAFQLQIKQETEGEQKAEEIWGQEIGTDEYPVLNGKKVYQNLIYSGCCEKYEGTVTKREYSNTEADTIYLKESHNFKNNLCVCGTYEFEPELKDGYYQIENAGHLYWFAQQVNSYNTNINAVLTADIVVNKNVLNADGTLNTDLKNLIEWTPIGDDYIHKYAGTFDGNNHTISGLYLDKNIEYAGLFGYNSGTIKNVGIIDSYFKGKDYVGGVCGYNYKGTIENSYNIGSVSGQNNVGGVCGDNYNSTIAKCYNTGTIIGNINVGGVCGYNDNSTIAKCYNTGTISGVSISNFESNRIGGICGQNYNGVIADSYNRGTVSGSDYNVGGICGYNYGMVENSYNTGSVSGVEGVGGVCGNNHINDSESKGTIANSYNTGTIRGLENVGGVSGQNIGNAIITNSYNTGTVIGLDDDNNNNNDKNNYYVGGVCGQNLSGTIKNSYNTGLVSVLSDRYSVGGVCGYNDSNSIIENSYYLKNCNAEGTTFTNNYGTEKTYAQFESGEVAYLLQGKQEAEIWGQKITKDKLPVLNSENKVYKVTAYSSVGNEIISEIYLNKSLTVIMTAVAPVKEGYNFKGWYAYDESNDNHYTGNVICSSREYDIPNNITADSEFMAVYEPLGTADITINCDREYTINGISKSSATTESYPIGSKITLSCDDTDFAYWQNNAGTILSRESKYSFVVTGKETISAVFNEIVDNKVTLIFESFYGQVIATKQLASDEIANNPDLPVRTGYTALGWDFDGDGKITENDTLKNAIEIGLKLDSRTVKIVPVYELIDETYTITVENGTGSGVYNENDIVTAVADEAKTGMKFSHWKDNANGNILSYNEKYVFYVSEDTSIMAVYVETGTKVDAKGATNIVGLNQTDVSKGKGKLSFVSMSTVPNGCKINKAGIIATNNFELAHSNEFTDKKATFVRGMSSNKKAVRYTWTKSVQSGETWYVRAYLVYTDLNGNVHTVYGDMISQKYE